METKRTKTILCYGDSNTHGSNPHGGRHPRERRWTGRLQMLLGEGYYVIEEGMGGRTTVWDDPLEPNRCGMTALPVALQTHKPLDLVILMLGTNDCKSHFHASARVIAQGVENLCNVIERYDYGEGNCVPEILLVSPILIGDDMEQCPFASFDETAPEKSRLLAPLYEDISKRRGYRFLDAAQVAAASPVDQLHMDWEGHEALAEAMEKIIVEI